MSIWPAVLAYTIIKIEKKEEEEKKKLLQYVKYDV